MTKVALITAGGSGMGAACARRLAADGYHVGVLSASGRGEALGDALGGFGVTGSNLDPEALARLVAGALNRWGRIDALVNSAGHGPRGPVLELSDDDWHQGMETYLMNVIRPVRLVVPQMVAQGAGAIVNISTAWAFEPSDMFPTSGVFRAGLAAFTKLVTDAYAPKGVRMNNVLPGWIDSLPERDERRAQVPMGRYGRADEIAGTVAFLLSAEGGYIAGQNLRVDGGLMRAV
ncbi:SDR family oxidoreductase [Frigidibacter sp. MR17.24]|uniref:SDR family oxidoreductase n=1 Tax=Frigidibacter sp. MR17.24 TaxID=3127345 RepID=UPI003012B61B